MRFARWIILSLLAATSSLVSATPDAALWQSMTLLGVNPTHYFVYVAEQEHPGSYYDYTTRVVIEKYHTQTNRRIARIVVRESLHHLPDPEAGKWNQQDKKQSPLNLGAYLVQENIHSLYPQPHVQGLGVAYMQGALYLTHGDKHARLRQLGDSRLLEDTPLQLAAIYIDHGHALIIVQQGQLNMDMDYVQKLLPVPLTTYQAALKQLHAKK